MSDRPSPIRPPAVAVIFTSRRTKIDDAGYTAMADEMDRLAAAQPGYLGIRSVRDPGTRLGITVSYWRDDASARAWKRVLEHREAQRLGRERWYERWEIVVAEVTRTYEGDARG